MCRIRTYVFGLVDEEGVEPPKGAKARLVYSQDALAICILAQMTLLVGREGFEPSTSTLSG